jgi:hypothetical protein
VPLGDAVATIETLSAAPDERIKVLVETRDGG